MGHLCWCSFILCFELKSFFWLGTENHCSSKEKKERAFGFLDTFGLGSTLSHPQDLMEVKVSEVDSAASATICNIQIRSDGEFSAYWPNFSICVIYSEKTLLIFSF